MRITSLATLFCLTSLASSCGGDQPTGSLIVPFQIGANVACSAVGVLDVTMQLWTMPSEGAEPTMAEEETVPCDDKQVTFSSVDAGRYEVRAFGVDDQMIGIVDNGGKDPVDTAEVTSGAENTADPVLMSTTPASVYVRWSIGGGFVQCSSIPTKEFRVSLFENNGANQLLSYTFTCDEMGDPMGYHLVLDEGRDIKGDQLDLILVEPLDAQGKLNGMGAQFVLTPPGHGRTVKVSTNVDCPADTCDVTCAVDTCMPD